MTSLDKPVHTSAQNTLLPETKDTGSERKTSHLDSSTVISTPLGPKVRDRSAPSLTSENKNGWTKTIEDDSVNIANLCTGYAWIYNYEAQFYNKWGARLQVISIVITFIGTCVAAVGISEQSTAVGSLATCILVHLATIAITVINDKINFQVNYELMRTHSGRFESLLSNIKRQTSLPYSEREKGKEYHCWVSREYILLVDLGPQVYESTYTAYARLAEPQSMPIPQKEKVLTKLTAKRGSKVSMLTTSKDEVMRDQRSEATIIPKCEPNEPTKAKCQTVESIRADLKQDRENIIQQNNEIKEANTSPTVSKSVSAKRATAGSGEGNAKPSITLDITPHSVTLTTSNEHPDVQIDVKPYVPPPDSALSSAQDPSAPTNSLTSNNKKPEARDPPLTSDKETAKPVIIQSSSPSTHEFDVKYWDVLGDVSLRYTDAAMRYQLERLENQTD